MIDILCLHPSSESNALERDFSRLISLQTSWEGNNNFFFFFFLITHKQANAIRCEVPHCDVGGCVMTGRITVTIITTSRWWKCQSKERAPCRLWRAPIPDRGFWTACGFGVSVKNCLALKALEIKLPKNREKVEYVKWIETCIKMALF